MVLPTMKTAPEMLNVVEGAAYARVSVSTLRHWLYTGRLRSVRPGRRRLIRRSDLESFLSRDLYAERKALISKAG
jgi:excisionase family DNA binding protein